MVSKTKKIAFTAAVCALAYALTAVGRVPVVLFLKYDPKDVIIALGGFVGGPAVAVISSVVVSVVEMFTLSETGIWGCIMNVISTCSFALTATLIYKKHRSLKGAAAGLVAGSVAMIATMMLWNYIVTPYYMGYPREAVVQLLIPAFLPFNAIKAGLNAGITLLIYKPVMRAFEKLGFTETQAESKPGYVGVVVASAALVITCVLFILSFNGII